MSESLKRMSEHHALIAQFRRLGRKILAFRAPCCGVEIEGMAATEGETWHTGATCPQCGSGYFRETTEEAITARLTQSCWGIA
jgi:hypothetical protein